MKNKKYLNCVVTKVNGDVFNNPLKLSEAYLVSQLAQEHRKVVVTCATTHKAHYDSMFG
ncbi:unnamed protein product [marine sediment metagenome]|uniref:Uncharacterized protein n=1 Tax=marine sediment metagenome TaxID=412755 RepID=X1CBP8_9ZZZZ